MQLIERHFVDQFVVSEQPNYSDSAYVEHRLRQTLNLALLDELIAYREIARQEPKSTALVIGGGWSGIHAARTLSLNGFHVAVIEDGPIPSVGAASPIFYHETVAAQLKHALGTLHHPLVDFIPNTNIQNLSALAQSMDPDLVVLAPGAEPRTSPLANGDQVRHVRDFFGPLHHEINSFGSVQSPDHIIAIGKTDIIVGGGNASLVAARELRLLQVITQISQKYGIDVSQINPRLIVDYGIERIVQKLQLNIPDTVIYHRGPLQNLSITGNPVLASDSGARLTSIEQITDGIRQTDGVTFQQNHSIHEVSVDAQTGLLSIHIKDNNLNSDEKDIGNVIMALGSEPIESPNIPFEVKVVGMARSGQGNARENRNSVKEELPKTYLAHIKHRRLLNPSRYAVFLETVRGMQTWAGYDGDPIRQIVRYAPRYLVEQVAGIRG